MPRNYQFNRTLLTLSLLSTGPACTMMSDSHLQGSKPSNPQRPWMAHSFLDSNHNPPHRNHCSTLHLDMDSLRFYHDNGHRSLCFSLHPVSTHRMHLQLATWIPSKHAAGTIFLKWIQQNSRIVWTVRLHSLVLSLRDEVSYPPYHLEWIHEDRDLYNSR